MKRPDIKAEKCWGIAAGGVLLPDTIRGTRRKAIQDFEGLHKRTWKALAGAGYRCVRVSVTYEKSAVARRQAGD